MKSSVKVLLALHLLLAFYSLSNVASKYAAQVEFLSPAFIALYGAVLFILAIYALGWQQIIKRMPLTTAYANKAVTIIWGIIFGLIFFGEGVTLPMLIGAVVIMAGIVLFAIEDGRMQEEAEASLSKAEAAPLPLNSPASDEDTLSSDSSNEVS
ncbi:MAG: transporter [Coriobacteriales bacterium]|nr:transporter [Coriobacteriales bacterium]